MEATKCDKNDDALMLSGIQHFLFCPRQWYLIYVEQIWVENHLTVAGSIMHQRADEQGYPIARNGIVRLNALPIRSTLLGLYGVADVVELHAVAEGTEGAFNYPHYRTLMKAVPIEYKHGKPKLDDCDAVQLAAQAMSLEEMWHTSVPVGYLFYGETRHRLTVQIDERLRNETRCIAEQMHKAFTSFEPIMPVKKTACRSCSLKDQCMPTIVGTKSVRNYLLTNKLFD